MKTKPIIVVMLLLLAVKAQAQDTLQAVADSSEVFDATVVTEMAEYPGGISALQDFIRTNLHYPSEAVRKNIQGKVFVKFVIEKNGKVSSVKILRGVHPLLDREAVRVISLMPNWKPARNEDKTVRQKFVQPINFGITNKKGKRKKQK